ncbi:hypothetical protein [Planomonospora sp. ID67723]|uniref:hypothetical protein n=1 Tax=Planomonospora sp. ID67723 TaxID=2738134 RepID=UPI0018C434DF|nr:hypothetical protein [Planomonospora sp. ID67723]
MSQHHDLDVLGRLTPAQQRQPTPEARSDTGDGETQEPILPVPPHQADPQVKHPAMTFEAVHVIRFKLNLMT